MNMMRDFSLPWKVSFLSFVSLCTAFNNIDYAYARFLTCFDMYICVSKLDELQEMSPPLPCNRDIERSLQPFNQPEVDVADESAGMLFLSPHGKFLVIFTPFDLAISVPRDSFTLKSLSFSTIHSVVFSLLILPIFPVLFVYFNSSGHSDSSLVLPLDVLGALQSKTDDAKEVVEKLTENLQLDYTSLKQPEPKTRELIRCLAREANSLDRRDVIEYLRQITPAGCTGRCDTGIVNDDSGD